MPITILIYEDNELLRESISSMILLNSDLHLIGAFKDVIQVEQQVDELRPQVILMDIEMPGRSGIEATRLIHQKHPDISILILTVFDDSENIFNAIKVGASGYLLKKHISARLFTAIDEVVSGGAPMSPSVARMVIASLYKTNKKDYNLTNKEREVLNELSKGNSYKMIASELNISIETVRSHIKKIYEKLQVHSQTEAVSKAINEGLV